MSGFISEKSSDKISEKTSETFSEKSVGKFHGEITNSDTDAKRVTYHILVNPSAKGGKGLKIWHEVEEYLQENGVRYERVFSKSAEHLRQVVEKLCEHKNSRLIVLGGDGTLNQVVSSITDFDALRVGYIPTGSGNDFARDLKLPADPIEVLKTILKDETVHEFDVGTLTYLTAEISGETDDQTNFFRTDDVKVAVSKANSQKSDFGRNNADGVSAVTSILNLGDKAPAFTLKRRFCVSSGIGFDAAVCEGVNSSKFKRVLELFGVATLAYLFIALRLILTNKRNPCTLIIDGQKEIKLNRFLFVASFIHTYEGGGFPFAPDADPSDGLFDLCIAGDISNLTFLFRGLPLAIKGRHFELKNVDHYLCKKVEIITEKPLFVHTDGEVLAKSNHILMECAGEKLKMLM